MAKGKYKARRTAARPGSPAARRAAASPPATGRDGTGRARAHDDELDEDETDVEADLEAEAVEEDDLYEEDDVDEEDDLDEADDVEDDGAAPAPRPWGMGGMALWWLAAQLAASFGFVLVIGLFASATGAEQVPAGVGAAVGEISGRLAVGAELEVTAPADPPLLVQALVQVPLWAVLAAAPFVVARRKGADLRRDFKWGMAPIDVPLGLAIGLATQLLLVPGLYWVLFRFIGEQDVSAAARELTDRATDPLGVVALFVIVGVGAPIAEELFYRGLSLAAITKRLGPSWGILLSALFFAFTHFQSLQFPALLLFGVVLAGLVRWTGRLGMAIWAHVGFNVVAAATLVWNLTLW